MLQDAELIYHSKINFINYHCLLTILLIFIMYMYRLL